MKKNKYKWWWEHKKEMPICRVFRKGLVGKITFEQRLEEFKEPAFQAEKWEVQRSWGQSIDSELDEKVDQIEVEGMSGEVIRHVAVDQMM